MLAIAWWARDEGAARAVGGIVAAAVACVLVLAPWFVHNASRFEDRVLISTNDGLAIAGSNCDLVAQLK